jgi:hypothetical protein
VRLLPDREPATAQAWFTDHPTIEIIARGRGGGYGEAAAKALPQAVQVADRWHLMENASRAFLDAVRKSMRQIRSVIGAATINPKLLTAAERIQYEGYLRREQTNAAILALAKDGLPLKQIARQTGHSRGLVRQVVRGRGDDVFRIRQSSLDLHLPWLDARNPPATQALFVGLIGAFVSVLGVRATRPETNPALRRPCAAAGFCFSPLSIRCASPLIPQSGRDRQELRRARLGSCRRVRPYDKV